MPAILFALAAVLFQAVLPLNQQIDAREASVGARIVLDGGFEDWNSSKPALVDPADAADSPVDFGEVRVAHDHQFVHMLVDFGRTVNVQGLDGMAMILLDVDGDAKTGRDEFGMPGVDLIVDLTPFADESPDGASDRGDRKREPGRGLALRSTTYHPPIDPESGKAASLNPYDIGFAFAPTYAARRFEFRIERRTNLPDTPPLFTRDRFAFKLVFIGVDGKVGDETDVITHTFAGPLPGRMKSLAVDNPLFAKTSASSFRVLTWNIERGAIFAHPEPFQRIITAINPDVLLFQELPSRNSADDVRSFLETALPLPEGQRWQVMYGEAGGDLHCAIASRFQLQPIETLESIPLIDRPDRDVRAACALLTMNDHKALIASVHLRCCGKADSREDQQRIAETQSINAAIANAAASNLFDAVIIAGDFNLVGTLDPVEIMAAGLDADHSNLTIVPAYQLDGATNATWSDRTQPFAPGRLDFMLFADSKLRLSNAFVCDSHDLVDAVRAKLHIEQDDSDNASDHMPIIADFRWSAD